MCHVLVRWSETLTQCVFFLGHFDSCRTPEKVGEKKGRKHGLTWNIAGFACRACHSSGTFFHCDTHTHTRIHTLWVRLLIKCGFCTRLYGKKKKKERKNKKSSALWEMKKKNRKKRPLKWLIQFVKDKLPLSGKANFLFLLLVQRPAFPTETILVFVGCTSSHLHHCRQHSFFINLQHHRVLWCRRNIAQKHNLVAAGTAMGHVADFQSEQSTVTIKLISCHLACWSRWASPCACSTRSVQSSAAEARKLVPLLMTLLSAQMVERATNLCKTSFDE